MISKFKKEAREYVAEYYNNNNKYTLIIAAAGSI